MVLAVIALFAFFAGRQILFERQLRARIVYATAYSEPRGSAIFAILDVQNAGIPTSVEPHSWHMHISVHGQDRVGGASSPSGLFVLRIGPHGNCKRLGYPETQTIYARGENVVETGGVLTGFMLASFPGTDLTDIDLTTIRVTFDDAFGKTHQTDKIKELLAISTFLKTPDLGQSLGSCG